MAEPVAMERISTGIAGLDAILHGGLVPGRAYLVRGGPGAGKTMFGLHFLVAGAAGGEPCLYIAFSLPEAKLRANAATVGFDLRGVDILDLSPSSEQFREQKTYEFFSAAEVERGPLTQRIIETVERLHPARVVVDAVTQLRYLTPDALQFRREMLAFLQFMSEHGATVYYISETGAAIPDDDLQFMADGIITLSGSGTQRSLVVTKFQGSDYQAGAQSFRITNRGIEVFPSLEPQAVEAAVPEEVVSSGIPELDALLFGGLERGTATFISGPSGAGKTTFGLTFARGAAERGERFAMYIFDESREALLRHAEGINIRARTMVERGILSVTAISPRRYSADEFAALIRQEVETHDARIVMIDSYTGYQQAVMGEDLDNHFHLLLDYLENHGVKTIATVQVENVTGDFHITDANISYLADNIVFIRYLEMNGQLRKAIGVLKKRLSDFEKTLREFEITKYGVHVGKPLTGLRGILRGEPEWMVPPQGES
ncbi:MAG: ATPase domain-containing protein [Armatimonadota bacterium]